MAITRESMRPAGSLAFKELKSKYPLITIEEKDENKTIGIFGDIFKINFDNTKKMLWVTSQKHYGNSHSFNLNTAHKNWHNMMSFPRQKVYDILYKNIPSEEMGRYGPNKTTAETLGVECKIICYQVYKADKAKMGRIVGGVLWRHYDQQIAKLCVKMYGLFANSLDYTLVWNNKEEVIDTLAKAPGIMPVWKDIVIAKLFNSVDHKKKSINPICDDGFEATPYPENTVFILNNFNYGEIKNLSFVFPDIIKTVKNHLEKYGLTSNGWRYLVKLPCSYSQTILFTQGDLKYFVKCINWLAHVGVVPRYSLIKNLLRNIDSFHRTEDMSIVVRKGLEKASKMRKGVKDFFSQEMHLVLDWFSKAGPLHQLEVDRNFSEYSRTPYGRTHVVLDNNQKKAGWDWFMRQQEAWHREAAAREIERERTRMEDLKKKTEKESWDSLLKEITLQKKYTIVPLTNSHALIEEGSEMYHCVGSYVHNCIDGRSRIFSIRNGGRIATLELRNVSNNGSGNWIVNQCYGPKNEKVSKAITSVAKSVAARYTKLFNTQLKEAIAI